MWRKPSVVFCEGSILKARCGGCGGSRVIADVRVASGVRTRALKGGRLLGSAALLDLILKGGPCPSLQCWLRQVWEDLSVTRNPSFKDLQLKVGGLFSRAVSAISGLSGKDAELISQCLPLCGSVQSQRDLLPGPA